MKTLYNKILFPKQGELEITKNNLAAFPWSR